MEVNCLFLYHLRSWQIISNLPTSKSTKRRSMRSNRHLTSISVWRKLKINSRQRLSNSKSLKESMSRTERGLRTLTHRKLAELTPNNKSNPQIRTIIHLSRMAKDNQLCSMIALLAKKPSKISRNYNRYQTFWLVTKKRLKVLSEHKKCLVAQSTTSTFVIADILCHLEAIKNSKMAKKASENRS